MGTRLDFIAVAVDPNMGYVVLQKFADEMKIPLFEVSAKDGTNVELAFTEMVAMAWTKLIEQATTNTNATPEQMHIHYH